VRLDRSLELGASSDRSRRTASSQWQIAGPSPLRFWTGLPKGCASGALHLNAIWRATPTEGSERLLCRGGIYVDTMMQMQGGMAIAAGER
jgi:hypothetical protein